MRFATWNLKQAIAPKKPIADLWRHTATDIDPHVMVFTEAKVPKDGVPNGWTAQWKEGGIGHRRRWGPILAGRGVELRPITHIGGWRRRSFKNSWPAALEAAEVIVAGRSWGAVIGIYGMLVDAQGERVGSGRISVPLMLEEVAPIVRAIATSWWPATSISGQTISLESLTGSALSTSSRPPPTNDRRLMAAAGARSEAAAAICGPTATATGPMPLSNRSTSSLRRPRSLVRSGMFAEVFVIFRKAGN